jgi:hypothetical protein
MFYHFVTLTTDVEKSIFQKVHIWTPKIGVDTDMMPTNMMGGASRPNISVGPEISSNIFSHAMLTSRTAIMMMMQTDFRNLDSPDFQNF